MTTTEGTKPTSKKLLMYGAIVAAAAILMVTTVSSGKFVPIFKNDDKAMS